tara:strand:- start:168 stop:470 length:303 start_codon:yes stop_codon:yes gene_type:complete
MGSRAEVSDIAEVIDRAVRAYCLAKRRATLKKTAGGRDAVRLLAQEFPESYSANGSRGFVTFCGESADEIIEKYLDAEEHCGSEWQRLASIVIARGEREE